MDCSIEKRWTAMKHTAFRLTQRQYDRLMTFLDAVALGDCRCNESPANDDDWIIGGEGETVCEACEATLLAEVIEKGKEPRRSYQVDV